MALFDAMQNGVFDITTNTFGEVATWTPSVGGPVQTAEVHYRKPNEKDTMTSGIAYMPFVFFMEYKEGVFPGLQESVRDGNNEYLTIQGDNHIVRSVSRVYDGKTFQAHLERLD